jgi:hypothetical protein
LSSAGPAGQRRVGYGGASGTSSVGAARRGVWRMCPHFPYFPGDSADTAEQQRTLCADAHDRRRRACARRAATSTARRRFAGAFSNPGPPSGDPQTARTIRVARHDVRRLPCQ